MTVTFFFLKSAVFGDNIKIVIPLIITFMFIKERLIFNRK